MDAERPETSQKRGDFSKRNKLKKKIKLNNLNYTDGKIKITYESEDLTRKYNDYD